MWLRRNDFVGGFVLTCDELAGEAAVAWVEWSAAVAALAAGRLPCSSGEAAVLRVAASLAEGISVDLSEAVSSLDVGSLVLVARAVLRAAGASVLVDVAEDGGDQR
jgi:hypothetical protein